MVIFHSYVNVYQGVDQFGPQLNGHEWSLGVPAFQNPTLQVHFPLDLMISDYGLWKIPFRIEPVVSPIWIVIIPNIPSGYLT